MPTETRAGETYTSGNPFVTDPKFQNILNNYRSYTYNFTLSGLTIDDLNDPARWRSGLENYVILKSGGKGKTGLSTAILNGPTADQIEANKLTQQYAEDPTVVANNQKDIDRLHSDPDLVKGFNQSSPGRFDMFIDKLEVTSQFAFNSNAGLTLGNNFNFTVVEPYSINGFIEALHAAAVATGYPNYSKAVFLLTVKFFGYPDVGDTPMPEEIPYSTRHFPITLTNLQMEVTERGTVYRCSATASTDMTLADSTNTLKKAISFEGKTVQEALAGPIPRPENYDGSNFVDRLNEMQKEAAQDRANNIIFDKYEIWFPEVDKETGELDFTTINKIGKTALANPVVIGKNGGFEDPQTTTNPTNYQNQCSKAEIESNIRFDPTTKNYQLQFPDNTRIHEIITNTVRDSEYVNNLLKSLKEPNVIDEYGFIDYFIIRTEIKSSKELNPETQKPRMTFRYIVTPYKIHISALSLSQPALFDPSKYKTAFIREYNYMYTGQNIDVLNFKLNFDYMFHQSTPYMTNNDIVPSSSGAGTENSVNVTKNNSATADDLSKNQTPPVVSLPSSVNLLPSDGPGAPRSDDPYRNLSRAVHLAFLNTGSPGQATEGELEIIGDPLYVTTGGIGNYQPKSNGVGFTDQGEANLMSGQVYIRVNFRNPIDIGTAKEGGLYIFDENLVPFSGIYAINRIHSSFNEGVFKQRIIIVRQPGQVENKKIKTTNFADEFATSANPLDARQPDLTDAVPGVAGQVSPSTLKRLGGSVLDTLGTAATVLGGAAILSGVLGKSNSALTKGLALATGAAAINNQLGTAGNFGSTPIGKLIGGIGDKLSSAKNLAPADPTVTKVNDLAKSGVAVDLLDKKALENIPVTSPPAVAPGPVPDTAYLASVMEKEGPKGVAKAFGVKDMSQISPDLLPPDVQKSLLASAPVAFTNPLLALKNSFNQVDTSVLTSKLGSVNTFLSGASVNIIPKDVAQVTSVSSQFGSNSSGSSPLDKIVTG